MRAGFSNRVFWGFYAAFLFVGAVCLVSIPKGEMVLTVNNNHNPYLDALFLIFNSMAELPGIVLVATVLLLARFGNIIPFGLAILFNTILIQVLKRLVFGPLPRPSKFFEGQLELQQVGDQVLLSQFSFPSGHTALAFCLFGVTAFLIPRKWLGLATFLMALGAGLARLYLNQHFFIDIYFGSMIGVLSAWGAKTIFDYLRRNTHWEWLDYSPFNQLIKRAG
jgi:membrane-associated phospholipid phosphatase